METMIWFFLLSTVSAAIAITLGVTLFADCMMEKRNSNASHEKL